MIAGCGFSRLIPQGKVYHQQDASHFFSFRASFLLHAPATCGRAASSEKPKTAAPGKCARQNAGAGSAFRRRLPHVPNSPPAGSLCRIAYAEGSLKPFWGKRRPALQNSGTPAAKNGLWRPQAAPRRNAGQGAETEKAPGRQGRGLSRIWGCGVSHAAGSVRLFHGREPNVPQRPEWPGTWSFSPQA